MHTHTVAIIFIPPGHPLDGALVLACIQHALRRGYILSTILRDWEVVAAHLAIGAAQVVVLATRTHRAGEVDRAEYVDEEQARCVRRRNAAVGRHRVPGALTTRLTFVDERRGNRQYLHETVRLLPRGDDGGFAERWLEARRRSRHTGDT